MLGIKELFFLLGVMLVLNGAKYDVHDLTEANFEQHVSEKPHFVMFYSDR